MDDKSFRISIGVGCVWYGEKKTHRGRRLESKWVIRWVVRWTEQQQMMIIMSLERDFYYLL